MGVAQQVAPQAAAPLEQKIVKEYIPVQKRVEELLIEADDAEVTHLRYANYLTRIYDDLSVIAQGKATEEGAEAILSEWRALDAKYGSLDLRRGRLSVPEWRERKRALLKILDDLGMGTSRPSSAKILYPPLRISVFNDCPVDCPVLAKAREGRRKWA